MDWVLPAVIEEQANARPDQVFVTVVDGQTLSYRQMRDEAAQVAGLLASLGIAAGDRVAVLLPNGLDFLRVWAGIGRLGAVAVLINSEATGTFLAHPLSDSGARAIVVDQGLLTAFEEVRDLIPDVCRVIVAGPGGSFEAWCEASPLVAPFPSAGDIACIMYTSGTTGPPKGVLMPHAHCFLFGLGAVDNLGVSADDHYYVCLPLSHANGLLMQMGAVLIAGASATVRGRFSATAWLDDVRACGATVTHTLGAISAFIISQAETPQDRRHRLRIVLGAPNQPEHERAWRDRFGIADVVGGYGMTEVNIPLYGVRGEPRPGTCGKPYDRYFEVQIHDVATGLPVTTGEVGEIVVRPRISAGFMAGYNGLADETVRAWHGLWFHTGDAARMDADGYVTFIDRIKDCIRRRGENISATDIEVGIASLEGVLEVSAFAVPSDIPGGEDEIMLAIVRAPDVPLRALEIMAHARGCLPRYAQPRYVRFVDSLPKTQTEKVRKAELRAAGIVPGTIDLAQL